MTVPTNLSENRYHKRSIMFVTVNMPDKPISFKPEMRPNDIHKDDGHIIANNLIEHYGKIAIQENLKKDINFVPKTIKDIERMHLIMFQDETKNTILLNKDIRFHLKIQTNRTGLNPTDDIYWNMVVDDDEFELLPHKDIDENAAHVCLMITPFGWKVDCRLKYSKKTRKVILDTAEQFLNASEYSLKNENLSSFIDNLFSCAELLAQYCVLRTFFVFRNVRDHSEKFKIFRGITSNPGLFSDIMSPYMKSYIDTYDSLKADRARARYVEMEQEKIFLMNIEKAKIKFGKINRFYKILQENLNDER